MLAYGKIVTTFTSDGSTRPFLDHYETTDNYYCHVLSGYDLRYFRIVLLLLQILGHEEGLLARKIPVRVPSQQNVLLKAVRKNRMSDLARNFHFLIALRMNVVYSDQNLQMTEQGSFEKMGSPKKLRTAEGFRSCTVLDLD